MGAAPQRRVGRLRHGGLDELSGEAGADHLNGGLHNDRCNGGTNVDTSNSCEVKINIP